MKAILSSSTTYLTLCYLFSLFGVFGAYLEWVEPLHGMILVVLSPVLAIVGVIFLTVELVRKKLTIGGSTKRMGLFMPFLAIIAYYLVVRTEFPVVNDVATNLEQPLAYPKTLRDSDGKTLPIKYTPEQVELIQTAYQDLEPLVIDLPMFRVLEELIKLLNQIPSVEVRQVVEKNGYVYFTQRSPVFRFVDDVVVQLSDTSDGQTTINWRSRSRVGRTDLGANARRILRLNTLLKKRIAASQK